MTILEDLKAQVERTTEVEASAVQLIKGIAARVQEAVDKAIAGGATAEQLTAVQNEVEALKAGAQNLADAVTANTPAA